MRLKQGKVNRVDPNALGKTPRREKQMLTFLWPVD
jgi:hypothetical protein